MVGEFSYLVGGEENLIQELAKLLYQKPEKFLEKEELFEAFKKLLYDDISIIDFKVPFFQQKNAQVTFEKLAKNNLKLMNWLYTIMQKYPALGVMLTKPNVTIGTKPIAEYGFERTIKLASHLWHLKKVPIVLSEEEKPTAELIVRKQIETLKELPKKYNAQQIASLVIGDLIPPALQKDGKRDNYMVKLVPEKKFEEKYFSDNTSYVVGKIKEIFMVIIDTDEIDANLINYQLSSRSRNYGIKNILYFSEVTQIKVPEEIIDYIINTPLIRLILNRILALQKVYNEGELTSLLNLDPGSVYYKLYTRSESFFGFC